MKRFPIIDHRVPHREGDTAPSVRSVPWELVEPLRERCMSIHDQTLERLAERNGLGPEEIWAHVHWDGRSSRDFWPLLKVKTPDELRAWLRTLGGEP